MAARDAIEFAVAATYMTVCRSLEVPSTSAAALSVGPAGAVPALTVDAAALVTDDGPQAGAGVVVRAGAAGTGVTLAVQSTAANESIELAAKGTGRVSVVGDLSVAGTITGTWSTGGGGGGGATFTFPYSATPITAMGAVFSLDATTSGGTFGVDASVAPIYVYLPDPATTVGCSWRFVVVGASGVQGLQVSKADFPSATFVGSVASEGGTVAAYTTASKAFNIIGLTQHAVPGDWLEVTVADATTYAFRGSTATSAGLPGITTAS